MVVGEGGCLVRVAVQELLVVSAAVVAAASTDCSNMPASGAGLMY